MIIIPASLAPQASLKNYSGSTLESEVYGCGGKSNT